MQVQGNPDMGGTPPGDGMAASDGLARSLTALGIRIIARAVDRPLHPDGEWGFDIRTDSGDLHTAWSLDRGYGIYAADAGYGEMPAERTADPNAAARGLLRRRAA